MHYSGSGSFYKWLTVAKGVDADQRSDLLANDDILAAAHDEAARNGDSQQPTKVDHHFICYVNLKGILYEIDSRAPFPRPLGPTSCDTLVKDAGLACNHLMKELNNVSFAAMALIPKK
uniref:ubiquitinyl hydrolase 1 n=1 Tax=Heterorhabditis bacteriophora TaxID=37862 RepID=A0A1I7XIN0_HETBA